MREYSVYVMASLSRCLYIGVTNDLPRRVGQHKRGALPGFTRKYRITKLVHFEQTTDIRAAIAREKQLKQWPRWRKEQLIEEHNPVWLDLSAGWGLDAAEGEKDDQVRAPDRPRPPGR